jgi:hypothetical protein
MYHIEADVWEGEDTDFRVRRSLGSICAINCLIVALSVSLSQPCHLHLVNGII